MFVCCKVTSSRRTVIGEVAAGGLACGYKLNHSTAHPTPWLCSARAKPLRCAAIHATRQCAAAVINAALTTMKATNMIKFENAAGYALNHWSTKLYGERPSDELLSLAAKFAKGAPGNNILAFAMAMRPEGVTSPQMTTCLGDVKHNFRHDQIKAGFVQYAPNPPAKNAAHKLVYHIELTAKGRKFVERIDERAAKAAAKAAGKANGTPARVVAAKGKKPTNGHAKGSTVPLPGNPDLSDAANAALAAVKATEVVTGNPALLAAYPDQRRQRVDAMLEASKARKTDAEVNASFTDADMH